MAKIVPYLFECLILIHFMIITIKPVSRDHPRPQGLKYFIICTCPADKLPVKDCCPAANILVRKTWWYTMVEKCTCPTDKLLLFLLVRRKFYLSRASGQVGISSPGHCVWNMIRRFEKNAKLKIMGNPQYWNEHEFSIQGKQTGCKQNF
jgi:hypothetical protein